MNETATRLKISHIQINYICIREVSRKMVQRIGGERVC